MKKEFPVSFVGLVVILSLITGALSGVTASVLTQESMKEYLRALTEQADLDLISEVKPQSLPGTYEEALSRVAEAAAPSVAVIRSETIDSSSASTWEVMSGAEPSGVVITSDGWILFSRAALSAWSVPATQAEVWVSGQRRPITKVVFDELSDLALVKVEAQNLIAIPFASGDGSRAGEIVFALLGDDHLLASSLVDLRARQGSIAPAEDYNQSLLVADEFSVGAPLVNAAGELVAFTQGNTAVSITQILPFVQTVLKDGVVTYAGLGAYVADLSQVLNIDPALKMNYKEGVVVTSLIKGPAKSAGLKVADLIVAVDSVPISATNSLALQLKRYAPDANVKLTIIRAGESSEVEVTLTDYASLIY